MDQRAKPAKFESGTPVESLAGTVERVTFHNVETGFCVLKVQARGKRDLVPVIGHAPSIGAGEWITATGIWAMEDLLWRSLKNPNHADLPFIHGWGHYHETYVKLDVGWRIQSTRLSRLRTEYHTTSGAVTVNAPVAYGAIL